MIANFQPADYALCGLTVVMAVSGLFRGFSGTLGFALATGAAAFAALGSWSYSPRLTPVLWMRAVGTLVAALLVFGLVRLLVKKIVNGLLAQPADAIFGFLSGIALGVALLLGWTISGLYPEFSWLVRTVAAYVR